MVNDFCSSLDSGLMSPALTKEVKTRDANRSTENILGAAERLFAERGFDGTSLADIGAEAGVSRGTPSYFFGSKEELYSEVLRRLFEAREAVLGPAFAQVEEWAKTESEDRSLERVLSDAIGTYLGFLQERSAFVRLIEREALSGGWRLASTTYRSSAIEDALRALRRVAPQRGLHKFDVHEVLICVVSLCFFPFAQRDTFLPAIGLDADNPKFLRKRKQQIVAIVLYLICS